MEICLRANISGGCEMPPVLAGFVEAARLRSLTFIDMVGESKRCGLDPQPYDCHHRFPRLRWTPLCV